MPKLALVVALPPAQIIDRGLAYFVAARRFVIYELVAHLHGTAGAVEITVSGARVRGKADYAPGELLHAIAARLSAQYGLCLVSYRLHVHRPPEETPGHLVLRVDVAAPATVEIESQRCAREVREFLRRMPGARRGRMARTRRAPQAARLASETTKSDFR